MLGRVPIPEWLDLVDIALVASFAWFAIRYFRSTRARPAAIGLALLGAIYSIALALELRMSVAILQGFFAVLVIVLVVVFQQELRRLFEQLGTWRWRGGLARETNEVDSVDLLVRSISKLAHDRTGALFVLPRREPIESHVEGGVTLNGRLSEPLVLSIFDESSAGHDGAVVLRGDRVERFAAHLPLSSNHEALGPGGTRHAAALGLSERCDAICIAVSEERGTVSVAMNGVMRRLNRPEDLARVLRSIYAEQIEAHTETRVGWIRRGGADVLMALAGTLLLWMVLVPGYDLTERSVTATIEVENLPAEFELETIEPRDIDVTLRGLRRDLSRVEEEPVKIVIDAYLSRFGRRTFMISPQDVRVPETVAVLAVKPSKIKISVEPIEGSE